MATYHHGNLRAALIEAGLKIIEEKGVRALTLRELAARVGVSRMAPYRHFPDKEALLGAICEAGFSEFADSLESARNSAGPDFAARLSAMAVAYVRFAAGHRAHYEVMFAVRRESEATARSFEILRETIEEGQRNGEVREGDPTDLARVVWTVVHGISTLHLDREFPAFTLFASGVMRAGLLP
ncbi:MAG TPA: TetR/AcrR family transcriptional regulator [Bryobacteraceae bacterium]|nr:TetR/AcrR family transcriptional regulator [Bryobacteraceae bacterium]